jgi:alanine racemase
VSFGARAVVRLDALDHNFAVLKKAAGSARICAVVKANAFGHGILPVSRRLRGADSLAVARLNEASVLRQDGIEKPIVLLSGVMTREELAEAIALDCEIVVHDLRQLELLESHGPALVIAWLKIDTGMHRLGIAPGEYLEYLDRLSACTSVSEIRLMTHLANADRVADPKTATQIRIFNSILAGFDGAISIANSAALLGLCELPGLIASVRTNLWVRPGIAIYGISPFPGQTGIELGLRPVMEFESRLIAVKQVAEGEGVGYGGTWQSARDTMIGIVSAGYGDGYSRFLPSGTPVLVAGRRAQLAGTVSMDMLAVDLGPGACNKVGDPVILWGDGLPVEEVAAAAGTIAYQLVCGITYREPGITVA